MTPGTQQELLPCEAATQGGSQLNESALVQLPNDFTLAGDALKAKRLFHLPKNALKSCYFILILYLPPSKRGGLETDDSFVVQCRTRRYNEFYFHASIASLPYIFFSIISYQATKKM